MKKNLLVLLLMVMFVTIPNVWADEEYREEEINLVEIIGATLDFKAGDKPVFTGESKEPDKYKISYERWTDENGNVALSIEADGAPLFDTFSSSKYTYHVTVYPEIDEDNKIRYSFPDDLIIKVNGITLSNIKGFYVSMGGDYYLDLTEKVNNEQKEEVKEPIVKETLDTSLSQTVVENQVEEDVITTQNIEKTIVDEISKISISGDIDGETSLVVTTIKDDEYKDIIKDSDVQVISAYNIEINNSSFNNLTIKIPISAKYQAEKITIFHQKHNGEIEKFNKRAQQEFPNF